MSEGLINFFNTQINKSQTEKSNRNSNSVFSKYKQLKDEVKHLDEVYQRALNQKTKRSKSIGEMNRNAQKIRVDFLKLYQNKRMKMMSRQKFQLKKQQQKSYHRCLSQRVRERKLLSEYQNSTNKIQEFETNQVKKQQNKMQKQIIKLQIKAKRQKNYEESKSQYQKARQQRQAVKNRNKKVFQILNLRSHLNHIEKIENQVSKIEHYEEIIKQFQQELQVQDPSRTFFLTSRKALTKSTRQGARTADLT